MKEYKGWACSVLTEFSKPVVIKMFGLVFRGVVMSGVMMVQNMILTAYGIIKERKSSGK